MTVNDYQDNRDLYHDFVVERHNVWLRRQSGGTQPWTNDPVLRTKKFCNVYRILDHGTQFVVRDLMYRKPGPSFHNVLMRCFLYRYTNRPEPWRAFFDEFGRYPMAEDLTSNLPSFWQDYAARGNPIFGNAYKMFVGAENKGMSRLDWVLDLTRNWFSDHELSARVFWSIGDQAHQHEILMEIPRCANFMAQQILTDVGYSRWVKSDESFVIAGPGAIRGAKAIEPYMTPDEAIEKWFTFFEKSGTILLGNRTPSRMDIQNTFCEVGKYLRWAENTTPRDYRAAHPTVEAPFLPPHY